MIKLLSLLLIFGLTLSFGCSKLPKVGEILPDKKTAYHKSKDLPVLEVPPDLTITEGEYRATIPGEAESTSLTEFERQRDQRLKRGNTVLGSGELEDEQWLALQGSIAEIWSKLRQFWLDNGFTIELDDIELGVMETAWEKDGFIRNKFRVFAEPDEAGVILFLSSKREERSEDSWLASVADKNLEKETLRKINLHFYGDVPAGGSRINTIAATPSTTDTVSSPNRPEADILTLDNGKIYLAIPQEFSQAWRQTGAMLQRSAYIIENSDQEKGTYSFLYFKPEDQKEEKSWLSKLKFWGDDDDTAIHYQLSLTGVGNKTEVIVLNNEGEWLASEDAHRILVTLRDLYQ